MMIILYTTLLLVIFQQNVHSTSMSSANITAGGLLDKSILKLEQNVQRLTYFTQELETEYETLKGEIIDLKKLHKPCEPCKRSTKDDNVCDCTNFEPQNDCLTFFQNGFKIDGVYRLKGPGFHILHAYCDQTSQGGGWTVFQRRQDGSVDFRRNWNDYKDGFGSLESEFWFGNENIHDLTKPSFAPKKSQLMINMRMNGKQTPEYVKYSTFEITDEATKYVLKINGFSGNMTFDPKNFEYNNNQPFSTIDSDNDKWSKNCASKDGGGGGWWYNNCSHVKLNGHYKFTKANGEIRWSYQKIQPEFVEMKIRRNV